MKRWWNVGLWSIAVVLIVAHLWVGVARPWAQRATASGQRVHSLVRVERSSGEHYILFALPEDDGHRGAVILWYGCAGCTQMQTLASYEPR